MVDAEQWDLIRVLANAHQVALYDPNTGLGGDMFMYIGLGESQYVRHPGLPDGDHKVRAESDMQALMDQDWIRMRKRTGESYTFVITTKGIDAAAAPPEAPKIIS